MKYIIISLFLIVISYLLNYQIVFSKRNTRNVDSSKSHITLDTNSVVPKINPNPTILYYNPIIPKTNRKHNINVDSPKQISYIIIKSLNPYACIELPVHCDDIKSNPDKEIKINKKSKNFKTIDSLYAHFGNDYDSTSVVNYDMDMRIRIENYDTSGKLISVICSNYSKLFYLDNENIYATNPILSEYLYNDVFKWNKRFP